MAFADTLFKADFTLDTSADGIIWVNRVEDPKAFGVVKLDEENTITEFIEKPQEFVSDLAIIGIYFFRDGNNLASELQYLIDNDIKDKGEYQLTNALENMKNKGLKFKTGKVIEWLDCGNKNATVNSNQRVLEFERDLDKTDASAEIDNSVIIQPCMILAGAKVKNSVIGPHVTVGKNSVIENSVISNSIIQNDAAVTNANFTNSMIGNKASYQGSRKDLSVGDFNEIKD